MANGEHDRDRLYRLLPAIYQERDVTEGYPLRALLRLLQEQADILQMDIQQLWDNFFIETCERWVIPYIGDLVGNNLLHDTPHTEAPNTTRDLFPNLMGCDLRPDIALRSRADVAKTIYYRRRKGTLPMLEELARDVTGWAAHAVAFFEVLGWTQHLNHLRLQSFDCPDLRCVEPVDKVNGPFDAISHTVDVRLIRQTEGWYNIRNIGFFLWRLRSYPAEYVMARQASQPWQYHFSPLGNPMPLFARWRREGDEAGLTTEFHVPGPIRPAAFYEDFRRYRELMPAIRQGYTEFYGLFEKISGSSLPQAPHSSLVVIRDGKPIEPDCIVCRDLESWGRPPAGFRGVLSGNLTPFSSLTATSPVMDVAIGGEGPHPAALSDVPTTLAEARELLEAAIRKAHPSLAFRGTQVVVVGDRLLVIPGTLSDAVVFGLTAGDTTTVTELGLDVGSIQLVEGVFSGRLHPFPRITANSPEVTVTIGSTGPRLAMLDPVPTTLAEARERLEAAIRGADSSSAFTGAQVLAVSDRLLVVPGTLSDAVVFSPSAGDITTVAELELLNRVGVDPKHGRIVFALHEEPTQAVDVYYHYGFSADLGGGPYERGKWLMRPELATLRLRVSQSGGGPDTFSTLNAALVEWSTRGKPNTIITILDNRTYTESMTIELADSSWLVIEAANGKRPHLQPVGEEIQIDGNHPGSELTLNGLLIEGWVHVTGELHCLCLLHTTLVPGRRLDENGAPAIKEPSLIVEDKSGGNVINTKLRVQLAFSITGPIRLPNHANGCWVLDSIVDGIGGTAIAATGMTNQSGPPATLERVTILGRSYIKKLPLASEVIFTEPVVVTQRQEGCVRFSFVPPDESQTPRRYRCQPDLEIAGQIEQAEKQAQASKTKLTQAQQEAKRKAIRTEIQGWLIPSFMAIHYGRPDYAQLRFGCPLQIRTGAEDGSEMGAFCHLKQLQRETNLRLRLEEYLPFGLDAGFIYVT